MPEDPDTVATRAADAVLAGHGVGSDDAIDRGLADDHADVRARALGAASRRGRLSRDALVAALGDRDAVVRRRACAIATREPVASAELTSALSRCLEDPDPLVVVGAATALGELRDAAAAPALATTATSHDDARCREAAVAALGAIGAPGSLDAVLQALEDRPAVRRRAAAALAAFDGPEVDQALRRALEDRDWQVREVAATLLDSEPR